jgi:uncharacterized membrane protein
MYVVAVPLMAITAFVVEPLQNFTFDFSGAGAWSLAYSVIAQSIVGYFLLAYANTNMESSIVAAFGPVIPLTAAIAAIFVLGEVIGVREIIGSLIILAGLVIVTYERHIEARRLKSEVTNVSVTIDGHNSESTPNMNDVTHEVGDRDASGDDSEMISLDEMTMSNPSLRSPTPEGDANYDSIITLSTSKVEDVSVQKGND